MPGRDPDALLCGGCGTVHRPAIPGDWLSGRAPRSHRGGHWFDPSIAHQVEAQVRDSETGPIPRQGTGPSGCLGGIWEINFSLPPGVVRVARCRTVPMAGPASAWWRRWDASSSSSRGTGSGADRRPGPERVLPAGLKGLDQGLAHPVRDVGIEAAHARHLVAEALLGEDVGNAVLGHPGPVAVPEPVRGQAGY